MTPKKIPFNYDINRMEAVDLVSIIHIDDYDTRFLELILSNEGSPLNVDGCTVAARFVTAHDKYLLRDDVPCEAVANTITIPIDAAAVDNMACDIKIEVNIVDGEKILTLPFPLWIRVRGSILDDAQVTPESEGTIPDLLKAAQQALDAATAAIEAASDYENMGNKPQINGVELIGNKTSAQLGLQKELTAGENIEIDESGVISSTGGVTDYNDLTNKPKITLSRGRPSLTDLTGTINFYNSDFYNQIITDVGVQIQIRDSYFQVRFNDYGIVYDFNAFSGVYYHTGMNRFIGASQTSNFPANLNDIDRTKEYFIIHYENKGNSTNTSSWVTRKVIGQTQNGEYVEYAQLILVSYPDINYNVIITAETPWQKVSGGSQIVSGVVSQNGTITFTDSDGNTFTTTGASVIGPQGDDYVLTNQDKTDIANIVLQLLPNADVMSF